MSKSISLNSELWNSFIFQNKNRSYGAYALRLASSRRHIIAFLLVSSALAVFCTVEVLLQGRNSAKDISLNMSVRTVLTNLEEDEQVEAPPVAPPERQEVYRQSIAFVAPVIASEDEVTAANEMHSQNELLNTKAVIGIFDQEGTSDPNARIREEAMLNAGISGNTGERQNSKVRVIAQVMPRFPGGKEEMYRFLQNNLSYPQLAIDNRTEGKVTLSFIVETNGEITAIQVVRGISPECDREASRVVAAMPRWLPVEQNGRPVRVQFTLPVFFVLQ